MGDGHFNCMANSSASWLPLVFMYGFVLTSMIMLMNMLIAMMAESFSLIYSNKQEYYLFDKARQTAQWLAYAPVPPPFNLLRAPYEILYLPYALIRNVLLGCAKTARTDEPAFIFPDYWLAKNDVESLADQIADFMQSNSEGQEATLGRIEEEVATLKEKLDRLMEDKEEEGAGGLKGKIDELIHEVRVARLPSSAPPPPPPPPPELQVPAPLPAPPRSPSSPSPAPPPSVPMAVLDMEISPLLPPVEASPLLPPVILDMEISPAPADESTNAASRPPIKAK